MLLYDDIVVEEIEFNDDLSDNQKHEITNSQTIIQDLSRYISKCII